MCLIYSCICEHLGRLKNVLVSVCRLQIIIAGLFIFSLGLHLAMDKGGMYHFQKPLCLTLEEQDQVVYPSYMLIVLGGL
jgi:hypothetical protein